MTLLLPPPRIFDYNRCSPMDPIPAQPRRRRRRRRHRAAPRQRSTGRTRRIFLILCAGLVLLAGAAITWKVVTKIRARPDPAFTKLINESNQTVTEAHQLAYEASPLLQGMLRDLDRLGLEKFRAEQGEAAAKIREMYRQAIEKFRLGERKLKDSTSLNRSAQMTPYLEKKIRSYDLYAQMLGASQEIGRMLMDKSIPTEDELLPKVKAAAAHRDELDRQAREMANESNELGKQILAGEK